MKHQHATILFALASLTLSQITQAVVPAPDGGYPGGNTAEGQNALFSLNTGGFNTAVGFLSLRSNSTGSFNTAIGAGALLVNTGGSNNSGNDNTATGAGALLSNAMGFYNTANGAFALFSNTTGNSNTANGLGALELNTSGESNTATGTFALYQNMTGRSNTANGQGALFSNTTGIFNAAMGDGALPNNTTGNFNTAVGINALSNNTSGSNNIALGAGAGLNIHTASDTICIGIVGVDTTDGCYIGRVFQEAIDPDNLAMAIDVHGKVGTPASSRRFKDDIKPMDKTSEAILALKPVTFHYKNDAKRSARFGLIAEEVADVNSNLVARDKKGKPYSVRYDQVNAMLLNEFLKEHKKVEEQQATITELKSTVAQQRKDFETTAAQQQKTFQSKFAEQKSEIRALASDLQKVIATVELNRAVTKEVALKQGTTASRPSKGHDGSEAVTP